MVCELCDCEGAGFLVSDGIAVCEDCHEESQELARLAYEEATTEARLQREAEAAQAREEVAVGGFPDCPW